MSTNRKKLRLDVDALKVEGFVTADGAASRGTVQGHDETVSTITEFPTCPCPSFDQCTRDGESCSGVNVCFCQVSADGNC